MKVVVIGAGLAGSEAAWQLAERGINVVLYEMRPVKMTPAHQTGDFAELVCSNSFRAAAITNAVGLLKEEMRKLGSLIMEACDRTRIASGGALAVDREAFSAYVTRKIRNHPRIEVINEEVLLIPDGPVIIASGPLTAASLSESIAAFFGKEHLCFFDAVAPIVSASSIDKKIAYLKSRYDKGEPSYYNCPLTQEEFNAFYDALIGADKVQPKDFEMKVFEACMTVEDTAARGKETLLFGPMKPVGLRHPETGVIPYAVVQLRQDDAAKTLYNMVGFQTRLKWGEQKRVFRMIPGLKDAEFVRYGVMHKNTFIDSPKVLNKYYQTIKRKDLFFAGQITGVEGYLESASSGAAAGINMYRYLTKKEMIDFTDKTAIGALAYYVSAPREGLRGDFQPMNVNFGIIGEIEENSGRYSGKGKHDKKMKIVDRSLCEIDSILGKLNE